jgi:hypothetical protein
VESRADEVPVDSRLGAAKSHDSPKSVEMSRNPVFKLKPDGGL